MIQMINQDHVIERNFYEMSLDNMQYLQAHVKACAMHALGALNVNIEHWLFPLSSCMRKQATILSAT